MAVERRYLRMAEAASSLNIEQLDLLCYGVECRIPIGVHPYEGIRLFLMPVSYMMFLDEMIQLAGNTPEWNVMLMPDTLKEIARRGKVFSGRGYRQIDEEWEILNVESESGITLGDLIVPTIELKKLSREYEGQFTHPETLVTLKRPVTQPEIPVTPEGRETFQKQIAGLALVIYRQGKTDKEWGGKPNKMRIADAVMKAMHSLPKELYDTLNTKGLGSSAIRQNISEGFKLIGFTGDE